MSRVSRGYHFEHEISKSLEYIRDNIEGFSNLYYCKFPDTRGYVIKPEKEGKYLPRAPSDFVVVHNNRVFFLEAKSSRNPVSYAFEYIKEHQWNSGERITKAGGNYVFLLCNRAKRNHHKIYGVVSTRMDEIEANCCYLGRKSVKWLELEQDSEVLKIVRDKDTRLWVGLRDVFA